MRFSRLLFTLILVTLTGFVKAQEYPVQVTVVTAPPYYNFLSYYGDQNNHLTVIATLTDFNSAPVNVRLRVRVEGPGYVLRTRQDIPVGNVFTLTPGFPVFIQGNDVLPLLQPQSLAVVSGNPDLNNLPEGFTTVCAEIVEEGAQGAVLSGSVCSPFFLQLMQPPQPQLPFCNTVVDTSSLFQTFQWSPPQNYVPAIGTDLNYTFSLYEWIDTTNFNIFQTGQGIVYSATTQVPLVQVSNFDVTWQTGRKYVWRVQAQLSSNGQPVQMITQQGLSQPCSFYYGKPVTLAESLAGGLTINLTAEALATRKGRATWSVTDDSPGEGLSAYSSFIVEYRRKPVEGENYVWPWVRDSVPTMQVPIYQLEPGKTYQVRVAGIAGDYVSEPTDIVEFTTPPARDYACGEADLPYFSPNFQPLAQARMSDVVQIGQFPMMLTYVQPLGPPGRFSGRGLIAHDFIGGAKVKVKFDNLLIDSDYNVREGTVHAVTDGVDAWLNDQYLELAGVDTTFNEVIESGGFLNDTTVFVVVAGDSVFFTFNGDLPIVIHGAGNVEYQFWPDGTMVVTNYGVIPSNDQLDATHDVYVRFEADPNQEYGFDAKQYDHFSTNYEGVICQDQSVYFVSNKSKGISGTETVCAVIHGVIQNYMPSEMVFRIAGGMTVLNHTQVNDTTFLVTLPEINGDYSIYAEYADFRYGKLNVQCYHPMAKKVTVVPLVAIGGITENEIETQLSAIYKAAGISLDVTLRPQFNAADFTPSTLFDNPNASLMAKYTDQMRELRDLYLETNTLEPESALLFIVAGFDDPSLEGYMVRGRRVGFIALNSQVTAPVFYRNIAHELGHGFGGLIHSWGEQSSLQGATNNLMDYGGGSMLIKSQWEALRNPQPMTAIFDDEEEASVLSTQYVSAGYLSNAAFVSASGITPNDVFQASSGQLFSFTAEELLQIAEVKIENGFVVSLFKTNDIEYIASTSYFNFSNAIVVEHHKICFYDPALPNRTYTDTVNGKVYHLIRKHETDMIISQYPTCESVSKYIYAFQQPDGFKRRVPICPDPESQTACTWTSGFVLNNVGSCAFRINRSSKQCLTDLPASTKTSLLNLLVDKIIDMSPSTDEAAYNAIDFEELGVEAPGWFPGVFNDGGAYDVGIAFVRLMSASVEQEDMKAPLRGLLSANNYELLRKFLVDWDFYGVAYPVVQLSGALSTGPVASNRTTSVSIYGQTFQRSILCDPYVISYDQYNNSVRCEEFNCNYSCSNPRMQMLANGTIAANASFEETFSMLISKEDFRTNGGHITHFLNQGVQLANNPLGAPGYFTIGGNTYLGTEFQDYIVIGVPRTYSYSGKQLDPFEPLTFVFTENHNPLGVEAGKPYIMPAVWGLCMEKAIFDEQEALEGRVIADKLMSLGGIVLAPFTGGASLGLTLTTIGVAEYDLAYLEIQQNQSLAEYQADESFRNAWNTVYTTVQIVDGIVAAPAVLNSIDDLYSAIRNSKFLESSKQFVNDGYFNFVKGIVNNADENLELANAFKEGWTAEMVLAIPKGQRPHPSIYLKQSYIDAHIAKFSDGASYLVPKDALDNYGRILIGRPDGQFVMSKAEMDNLLASANGDLTMIETELGIPSGLWANKELVRIDIPNPNQLNGRIPTGNEAGANELWLPGGELPNGRLELVIDQIPEGQYIETVINMQ